METIGRRAPQSLARRRGTAPVPRAAGIGVLLLLALARPVIAAPAVPWTVLLAATFRILADAPGWPVNCTGWYVAPLESASDARTPISAYVTAGHCAAPQVVESVGALEQTMMMARFDRPGADVAIGARMDLRSDRTFPPLAASLPRSGERALVAGFSDGHLSEAVLSTLQPLHSGLLAFHSDLALRPGMSGAPIVSLSTGEIVGLLIGVPHDGRGAPDPHTIIATPATALRSLMDLTVPGALGAAGGRRFPSSFLIPAVPQALHQN